MKIVRVELATENLVQIPRALQAEDRPDCVAQVPADIWEHYLQVEADYKQVLRIVQSQPME